MEYKTPVEIAEEMKLNPETVRRMCKRGDMYAIKCGNQWRIPVGNPDQWQIPYVAGSTPAETEQAQSSRPQEADSEKTPRKNPSTENNHSGKADVSGKNKPAKKVKETGRNDPCPCGSGRKYKRCCLSKSVDRV